MEGRRAWEKWGGEGSVPGVGVKKWLEGAKSVGGYLVEFYRVLGTCVACSLHAVHIQGMCYIYRYRRYILVTSWARSFYVPKEHTTYVIWWTKILILGRF